MHTNESATADSGATTSNEVDHDVAAPAAPTDRAEEFREANAAMRYQFLECNLRIQQAKEAGDVAAEAAARRDREDVARQFVAKNTRLAQLGANPVMIKDRDTSAEHFASAMLGLWEAFVGTDPERTDGVIVAEDGTLHPTAGWDPSKGTFATWAGSHISGKAKRSVRISENAFTGISYHTWNQKPKVDEARTALAAELGYPPSTAEVAERAGVTEETVRAVSRAAPKSLDANVGDGNATLGDLVAETTPDDLDPDDLDPEAAEEELLRRAAEIATADLMVLLLRTGVATPERSVVETADKLGLGRGSVGQAMVRAQRVLNAS